MIRRPGRAFTTLKEQKPVKTCLLLYAGALLLSAFFHGQLARTQELAAPLETTYFYRLGVELGWGVLYNSIWFAF
ncbi:MAG TPA: hypothetical protein PLL10_05475, partial [Elusimicrobiales bacterium]|nr:hypothetical protein [Elusimicrobiales bacterium]